MNDKVWKIVAIVLISIIIISLFYFLVKGLVDYNIVRLTKVRLNKQGILNNLFQKVNIARKFKRKKLEQYHLTEILWAGYGKTKTNVRTVYSFLDYPLHIYICIGDNDIQHLESGLYEYKPEIHSLKRLDSNGVKKEITELMDLKGTIPAMMLITVDSELYSNEKEAVFFEAGGVTANILLKSKDLKLKMKLLDDFNSDMITEKLELNDEKILLVMLIGQ